MTNPIPFPARSVKRTAELLLLLSASRESLSRPQALADRPVPPEPLGNMLQRLALHRPLVVFLLENVVAEMLEHIDRPGPVTL